MEYLNFQKKNIIKVPKTITVLYCNENNILTLIGPLKTQSINVKVKVFFSLNLINVSNLPINKTSAIGKKEAKLIQGVTIAKIKQLLIEINYKLYRKLKFVGVGYRVFQMDSPFSNQIYLKLGYSHLIYFKIPKLFNSFTLKFTKLFIFGNSSLEDINKLVSNIRSCKMPDPYKGKGILYNNEKITLKKGKKI